MMNKIPMRRYEIRDEDGSLVAVIEVMNSAPNAEFDRDTVELAVDTGGSSLSRENLPGG